MLILDLDLDFFVEPTPTGYDTEVGKRADRKRFKVAPMTDVRIFLERNLGLSQSAPLIGCEAVTHEAAFWYWREEIYAGRLIPPLHVVHVDNHADLGMGDAGWLYLTTELMPLPLQQRTNPSSKHLSEGNYLAFAIAAGWIGQVTYVAPSCRFSDNGIYRREDRIAEYFVDRNPASGLLSLPTYSKEFSPGSYPPPVLGHDPPIPFLTISADSYRAEGRFAAAFLAHSPRYTPRSADKLLPLVRKYLLLKTSEDALGE